jgi:hypothetical protein
MGKVTPYIGEAIGQPATSKSRPALGGLVSNNRAPTDPVYITDISLRGLVIGSGYSLLDDSSVLIQEGEFLTDPTTISDHPAYTESSDIITGYGMYYGYKYKTSTFIVTRLSTLVYIGLDTNSNTTLSRAAASALTGISADAGTKKITVTSTHSWSNIYDYMQYWQSLPAQAGTLKDGEILSTVLGNNYNLLSTWQLVLEAEVTGGVNFVGDVVINAVFNLTGFNVTGTVFFDAPGTYSWTNMTVDEVDTIAGETVTINPTNTTITLNSDPANITINAPTISLTLNSSESSSDLKIFQTGTQTIEASATGTTVNTTTAGTYDVTVQKAGFLPQRQTGVVLGASNVTVDITLVADPIYASGHGLLFGTNYSYNASTRVMTIVANQEGRDLYSALIDDFISETTLRNCPFPLVAVGPDRIDFKAVGYYNTATTVGSTIDAGDIQFWKGAGMEWEHDTTGNPTKKFYSIKSANTLQASSVVGYTQVNAGTPVEVTLVSNQVNQVIQYFEDTDGNGTPDYNYTGHLLFKAFLTGYYQARWDVINDSGVSSLEPYEYTINLLQDAMAGTTGDQAITITTLTDHTGAPIDPGSSGDSFDYELVDPGANSAGNLLSQYNYDIYTAVNTSISGTVYTSYQAFDLPDLMIESGSNFETEYGYFEGDGAVTDLSGVYVSQSGGDHPGFTRFQGNDGTYYTPTVFSAISITGMPTAGANIRLQITNETAKTASAWQATTAYVLGDKVLRTTGVGTENTAGLYFVCTTAGTTGGTEPTWVTTPGSTTNDGTVVWTTYKILYYDADPASASYADTYIDNEEFATGDTFGIRFAEMNAGTSFKTFETTGVVSSTGFTVVVNETADSVYATNAVDGSSAAVTDKFTADYVNDEIDLDANQDFAATEAFAYYCYELTTSQGMYQFWGAVTAIDEANYRINTSVVSIYFDETAGFVKQTDSARIFRSDGVRPALDPTTGGNGLEINWRNPVYGYDAGGGGFTAGDRATLDAAATQASLNTVDSNVDAILVDTGTTLPATLTTIEGKVDTVDTSVDAILIDTGTTIPAQITSATSGLSTFDPATDTLEGAETYNESLRIMRAATAGKSTVTGDTVTFRDAADTKDRITSETDSDGQRTSVTTDGS